MSAKVPVRERLLDAATRLMFVDGSVSTPVDVLLKEAGASAASLYAHFGNKDGLLAEALERRLEVWSGVWDRHWAAAGDSPRDQLLSVFAAMEDYHHNRLEERWCSFHATASAQPDPAPAVARVLAADRDRLRTRLAQAATALHPDDPARAQRLAGHVEVAYEGMLALMLRGPSEQAIAAGRATAEALVDAAPGTGA